MNSDVSLIRDRPPMGLWATPLAYLFEIAARTRLQGFDKNYLKSVHPGVFTVSIGGIEAGGTGKTPWAEYILRTFSEAGKNPGLLSRGYGRSAKGLVVRQKGEAAFPHLIGDEPAMIVNSGLDIPVAAVSKRVEGAAALVQAGCDTIVLDDGFSHRWLRRDVDILVMRGEAPLGSGYFLPRGTLREPVESVQRAHILVLHFRDSILSENVSGNIRAIKSRWPDKKLVVSTLKVRGKRLDGAGVFVACAVARPEGVIRSVEKLGGRVLGSRFYADHHRYTEDDLHEVQQLAKEAGADALVVTEKDAVKLRSFSGAEPGTDDLITVGAGVEIQEGVDELAELLGLSSLKSS